MAAMQSVPSGDTLAVEAAASAVQHLPFWADTGAATGAGTGVAMHSLDDDPFRDDWPYW
jgi:hypothetical protein